MLSDLESITVRLHHATNPGAKKLAQWDRRVRHALRHFRRDVEVKHIIDRPQTAAEPDRPTPAA